MTLTTALFMIGSFLLGLGLSHCWRRSQRLNASVLEAVTLERDRALQRYRTLTDNLAAAVIVRDPEGKIVYASPFTEVLTGYSIRELTELDFISLVHEADRDSVTRSLRVAALGEAFQYRYRMHHHSGIELWVETRAVPIADENGELLGSLAITFDITGLMRSQQQVEERNRDLQEFTYMVSHDLKAPLFTIKGMVSILESDHRADLGAEGAELVEHINIATRRLESLVGSILTYSKVSLAALTTESIDLNTLAQDLLVEWQLKLHEVGGALHIDQNLPTVLGDKIKLFQIFSNLIDNAIKYRDPQRSLEVRMSATAGPRGNGAVISIRDNGLGIPADKQATIFQPFHRAHSHLAIEGSGIGLATVKKLVERLGGSIELNSTPDAGTEFRLTFRR